MGCFLEPESRKLVKNPSFVRDATGQDNIEGGDAVGRHNEKFIIQIVNVPDLTPPKQRNRQTGFQQNRHINPT
jgi:hypothetical protein